MKTIPQKFYSNGKLLLTAEYLVLDGALALAIPTTYGQSLTIEPFENGQLCWESYDELGKLWFTASRSLKSVFTASILDVNKIEDRMLQILRAAQDANPNLLTLSNGIKIKTQLDFPRHWGLGTSSTLINNVAHWAEIDAYQLLSKTFGGSGYDIACAQHLGPLTYQLENHKRTVIETDFNPSFKEHLYFVFLNKKQNSREAIAAYKKNNGANALALSEINAITNDMISCSTLETYKFLMESHETILAKILKQKPVKEAFFSDFKGSIKSLGAWGGDFVMVASEGTPENYFRQKGYTTVIPYKNMVL